MEEHLVKHCAFRMTLTIYSAHGRDRDSRNVPGSRDDYFPQFKAKLDLRLERELVNGCLLAKDKTQTSFYKKTSLI